MCLHTMLSCCMLYLLLSLLICLVNPATASVDPSSFRDCDHFLYRQQAPTGIRIPGLWRICQRYGNKPRYATLYDSAHRVPLYSAYTFKGSTGDTIDGLPWMHEPQLSSGSAVGDMQTFPTAAVPLQSLEESQAVLADYSNAVSNQRGQLNPDQHQLSPEDKASTYTLTNVVPLASEFLHSHWLPFLNHIRLRLNNYCRGTAYIVTGMTTMGQMIRRDNVDRLSVPKHLWSAYCCPKFDPSTPYELRYKFPSYAAYGLNDVTDNTVTETSTKAIEALVKKEMGVDKNFQLFDGNCAPEV